MPKDTIIPINNEIILRASRVVFAGIKQRQAAVRNGCVVDMRGEGAVQLSKSPIDVAKLSMNVVAPV